MLPHYHKGIRVVHVVHKAHKPSGVVVRVLVHLSRTAFGAQVQALVVIFAILGFYIIAHQLLQLGGSLRAQQLGLVLGNIQIQRLARLGGQRIHLVKGHRLAVVGNGRHIAQHGNGRQQRVALTDARPTHIIVRVALFQEKAPLLGIQLVADGHPAGQPQGLYGACQLLRPQLNGDLGKGSVAALGQRLLKGQAAVHAVAANGLALARVILPGALPGAVHQVRNILNGTGGGHQLKSGTGGIKPGHQPVDIHALVGGIGVQVRRLVLHVIRGGGHSAHNVTSFVIDHAHGARLVVAEQTVRLGAHPAVYGQLHVVALAVALNGIHAEQQVVTG